MKKFLSRVLISSLLCGAVPALADDDHGSSSSSSGGGGGGSSSGAAIGIAVGGVAIAGLIGYLIYRANKDKDKDQGLPKAEDPFAVPSSETATTNSPPSSSTGAASGGIGSNQKLEF